MPAIRWDERYRRHLTRLPALIDDARPTLCGLQSCVDVYLRLDEAAPALAAAPAASAAGRFFQMMLDRARRGVGGEVVVDWPDGPDWLRRNLAPIPALGGTGPQAAQTLAVLGAPALVALDDRSACQLDLYHPDVLLAEPEGLVPAGKARRLAATGRPPHPIVEFGAGDLVLGEALPRSSRVIVRFADDPLENDPDFARESLRAAPMAGAGILSGFNGMPAATEAAEFARAAALGRGWREAGLEIVHLECGDHPDHERLRRPLLALGSAVSSYGLSLSELDKLVPDGRPPQERAAELAAQFGLLRVAVHYDSWAMAVSRLDPAREQEALLTGGLVASTRAAFGRITRPTEPPPNAVHLAPPPGDGTRIGGYGVTVVATPYLSRPAATIGLGDSFLAGTLLALGRAEAEGQAPAGTRATSSRARAIASA